MMSIDRARGAATMMREGGQFERLLDPLARDGAPPAPINLEAFGSTPTHRIRLSRWWGEKREPAVWLPWIMLNPSRADEKRDDPTLREVIRWTWRWGFDGLWVVNIYSFRTSKPRELAEIVLDWDQRQAWDVRDDIWGNHQRIGKLLMPMDAAMVAWGCQSGRLGDETSLWVENMLDVINEMREHTLRLFCLGTTRAGDPKHPMARGYHRIPRDARPQPFKSPGTLFVGDAPGDIEC